MFLAAQRFTPATESRSDKTEGLHDRTQQTPQQPTHFSLKARPMTALPAATSLKTAQADACVTNTGICLHGEYGPSDIGNQCDVYVENPTDATVAVTLYGADGVALGSFRAGPGSTLVTMFENAQCPASASVE
jgi:hypothetical protein